MNANDLELKIAGLEKAIQEHKADASRYEDELKQTNKQLADYNKPELTSAQLDEIQCAIESGVENFDFSDPDNYNKEFELDYDGRICLSNLEMTDTYELVEIKVHNLFKEIDCPEDEDNFVNEDDSGKRENMMN